MNEYHKETLCIQYGRLITLESLLNNVGTHCDFDMNMCEWIADQLNAAAAGVINAADSEGSD